MRAIAAGSFHSLFLGENSKHVWVCGAGTSSVCGAPEDKAFPTEVMNNANDIKMVAAGSTSFYLLTTAGEIIVFGENQNGQLGVGKRQERCNLVTIPQLPIIRLISAGNGYAMLIDEDGNIWSAGSNNYGQLGSGTLYLPLQERRNSSLVEDAPPSNFSFRQISLPVRMVKISCGELHSLFVDESEQAWATGWNKFGQLGFHTDELFISTPRMIEDLPNITDVAAGWIHSLFLNESGIVWGSGSAKYGNLGFPPTEEEFGLLRKLELNTRTREVHCSLRHSAVLDYEGRVFVTGGNMFGQLGLGDSKDRTRFCKVENIPVIEEVALAPTFTLFLDLDGGVWACGSNNKHCIGIHKPYTVIPTKIEIEEPIGHAFVQRGKSARN